MGSTHVGRVFRAFAAVVAVSVTGGCGRAPDVATHRCAPFAIGDMAPQTLCYEPRDGLAVFEGDIVLGTEDTSETRALRYDDTRYLYFRWPKGVIPYVIGPNLVEPERVTQAIAHYHQHTKFRFVKRTTQADYVLFRPGNNECWSWIGRKRGMQEVRLSPAPFCTTGTVIHEIGHALGLWHEHTRSDRDKFITVHWENILPGLESNFKIQLSMTKNMGAYDYGSIMHYAWWGFSKNGQPTMTKKDGSTDGFGQQEALSAEDIRALHAINGI